MDIVILSDAHKSVVIDAGHSLYMFVQYVIHCTDKFRQCYDPMKLQLVSVLTGLM